MPPQVVDDQIPAFPLLRPVRLGQSLVGLVDLDRRVGAQLQQLVERGRVAAGGHDVSGAAQARKLYRQLPGDPDRALDQDPRAGLHRAPVVDGPPGRHAGVEGRRRDRRVDPVRERDQPPRIDCDLLGHAAGGHVHEEDRPAVTEFARANKTGDRRELGARVVRARDAALVDGVDRRGGDAQQNLARTGDGRRMSSSTPGRPPRFSRERLAQVAFEIADQEGFGAVSMRRVAKELGAGTMTLYNYVRTKDELVALMGDHLMGELLVSEQELARPWRDAFTAILRRTYRLRVQHPWSLTALQNAGPGRNALRHAEQTLAALEGSPFSEEQKFTVMAVTDSFVDGHALHRSEVTAEQAPAVDHSWSGSYPRLRRSLAALEGWRPEAAWMDESFERGLTALLDGFVRPFGDQP
jgi:AcrR family transcriptional regulator